MRRLWQGSTVKGKQQRHLVTGFAVLVDNKVSALNSMRHGWRASGTDLRNALELKAAANGSSLERFLY